MDEIYLLTRHGGFNYNELMSMPVYKRRYFINERCREAEEEKKQLQSVKK